MSQVRFSAKMKGISLVKDVKAEVWRIKLHAKDGS